MQGASTDENWVNPRNLHVLSNMGYPKILCAAALRKSKNDVTEAVRFFFFFCNSSIQNFIIISLSDKSFEFKSR